MRIQFTSPSERRPCLLMIPFVPFMPILERSCSFAGGTYSSTLSERPLSHVPGTLSSLQNSLISQHFAEHRTIQYGVPRGHEQIRSRSLAPLRRLCSPHLRERSPNSLTVRTPQRTKGRERCRFPNCTVLSQHRQLAPRQRNPQEKLR